MAPCSSFLIFAGLTCMARALQSRLAPSKGIWLAKKERVALTPGLQSFSLADVLSGSAPAGLEDLADAFRGLQKGRVAPEQLQEMMKISSAPNGADYVDPQLQADLANSSVQESLRNLTENPELLAKKLKESPMVQQLEAMSPMVGEFLKDPKKLQRIFSPEMLSQLQSGHGPDEASLQEILAGTAASAKSSVPTAAAAPSPAVGKLSNVTTVELGEGLKLRQVRAGDGKTFPQAGDQVSVQYTGFLKKDGTSFDSSRDRGLFSFRIGAGEVIRGWDVGLLQMSLGERAVLHVPASMGYGSQGQGPIPADADLIFDVDLRGINSATA